jgi:hypothetical protein
MAHDQDRGVVGRHPDGRRHTRQRFVGFRALVGHSDHREAPFSCRSVSVVARAHREKGPADRIAWTAGPVRATLRSGTLRIRGMPHHEPLRVDNATGEAVLRHALEGKTAQPHPHPALIALCLHDEDRAFVECWCIRLGRAAPDPGMRAVAALGISYLACRFRKVDSEAAELVADARSRPDVAGALARSSRTRYGVSNDASGSDHRSCIGRRTRVTRARGRASVSPCVSGRAPVRVSDARASSTAGVADTSARRLGSSAKARVRPDILDCMCLVFGPGGTVAFHAGRGILADDGAGAACLAV